MAAAGSPLLQTCILHRQRLLCVHGCTVFKYRASVLFFQAFSYLSFLKVLIQLVLVKFGGLSFFFFFFEKGLWVTLSTELFPGGERELLGVF